jgi:hypothetical protein
MATTRASSIFLRYFSIFVERSFLVEVQYSRERAFLRDLILHLGFHLGRKLNFELDSLFILGFPLGVLSYKHEGNKKQD